MDHPGYGTTRPPLPQGVLNDPSSNLLNMPDGSPLCVQTLESQENRLVALEGRVVDLITDVVPAVARMEEALRAVAKRMEEATAQLANAAARLEALAAADGRVEHRVQVLEEAEKTRKAADTERRSAYLKWTLGIAGTAASAVVGWLLGRLGVK